MQIALSWLFFLSEASLEGGRGQGGSWWSFTGEVQPAEQWGSGAAGASGAWAAAGQSFPKGLLLTLHKCVMVFHIMLIPSPPGKDLWPCKSFYSMQDLNAC